jgi:hypothetical protein
MKSPPRTSNNSKHSAAGEKRGGMDPRGRFLPVSFDEGKRGANEWIDLFLPCDRCIRNFSLHMPDRTFRYRL